MLKQWENLSYNITEITANKPQEVCIRTIKNDNTYAILLKRYLIIQQISNQLYLCSNKYVYSPRGFVLFDKILSRKDTCIKVKINDVVVRICHPVVFNTIKHVYDLFAYNTHFCNYLLPNVFNNNIIVTPFLSETHNYTVQYLYLLWFQLKQFYYKFLIKDMRIDNFKIYKHKYYIIDLDCHLQISEETLKNNIKDTIKKILLYGKEWILR